MAARRKPNIIWVVTDSARNFSTGGLDDRDRPAFYDKLLPEYVSFENAVTSAPSSVMSGSCMLTGMNAYYIGRNYDDFRYEDGAFPNIAAILRGEGYETKGIFVAREMREKIAPFIGMVERKYWPKELTHSSRMWSNGDANRILKNFLAARDARSPLFLMVWNNIRHDAHISRNLEELTNILKEQGVYEDSVVIFCADHGYPHPRRGFTPEHLKREGLTHDLMLSDDNMLIPLLIKTPDCRPAGIKAQVGTIDLFPTVLDYAGAAAPGTSRQDGATLRPVLRGENGAAEAFDRRPVRCDCRFFGQSQRKTAIRLGRYKYVYAHDGCREEFFDIAADPSEDVSLLDQPGYTEIIEELRQRFQLEEQRAEAFQEDYMAGKLVRALNFRPGERDLVIFSMLEPQMNDGLIKALETRQGYAIRMFAGAASPPGAVAAAPAAAAAFPGQDQLAEARALVSGGAHALLLVSEDRAGGRMYRKLLKASGIRRFQELNINFQAGSGITWNAGRLAKALASRKELFRNEPALLITYTKEFTMRLLAKAW